MGEKVTAFREPPYIHVACVVLDLAFKFSIKYSVGPKPRSNFGIGIRAETFFAGFLFLCFPQREPREETRESQFTRSWVL